MEMMTTGTSRDERIARYVDYSAGNTIAGTRSLLPSCIPPLLRTLFKYI